MPAPRERPPRILLTGSGHRCDLGASYLRAFAALGHEVELFDWYGHLERWSAAAPGRAASVVLTTVARRYAAAALLARVRRFRPHVVVLLKTDDLPRVALALLRAAPFGCRVVAFHPDDPFNVSWLRGPSHPRAAYQMSHVDHYFLWSERLLERARPFARAASYLGFGWDPEVTRPIDPSAAERERFGADVSFIGNWDAKRETWLAPIAHSPDVSLAIWGTEDWARKARDPRVRASWRGQALRHDDLARAARSSRVSINVLRPQNETAENMRTYELPGCGVVMLAEASAQQERVFREGVEAVYARSPEELLARARAVRSWPEERRAVMGAAALRRAGEHTYRARARSILEVAAPWFRNHSNSLGYTSAPYDGPAESAAHSGNEDRVPPGPLEGSPCTRSS
ncbi:MAG TPA: glycosyltransferase [Polyangiaceae bacterium]|nr:glycosyltransferase [Polyangiaceae bacterium]